MHLSLEMSNYVLTQVYTCTYNYVGVKQACNLLLLKHQRRDCQFDQKLEENLIRTWEIQNYHAYDGVSCKSAAKHLKKKRTKKKRKEKKLLKLFDIYI